MYPLKTIATTLKALKANVAVYKNVYGVEIRVMPVEIYKMPLIVILANLNDSLLYTYTPKAMIEVLLADIEKAKTTSVTTVETEVVVVVDDASPLASGVATDDATGEQVSAV